MNPEKEALLAKTLKDAGYSVTTPRKIVFRLLNTSEPQSVQGLQRGVEGVIDRASLYRVINLFEKLGIVQRITVGWKYKLELTDMFNDHHHHISCLGCGKLVPIEEDEQIEHMIGELSRKYGITVERHQLEIQGYCTACRATNI